MNEQYDNLWGELRASLNSTQSHNALLQLLSLLKSHQVFATSPLIQEYVCAHVASWPPSQRTAWRGDFEKSFKWLASQCHVLEPSVFKDVHITSSTSSVQIDTHCGLVKLTTRVNGKEVGTVATYQGYGLSASGIRVYAWDAPQCRVELELVPLRAFTDYNPPLIDDGYLATWVVTAREHLKDLFACSTCVPSPLVVEGVGGSGERYESLEWQSPPLSIEDGHAVRKHLCIGSYDIETMEFGAGLWWPPGQECDVHYNKNSLDIELPELQPGQSCLVRSAGSWGIYNEERVEAWLTSDGLLDARKVPPRAT